MFRRLILPSFTVLLAGSMHAQRADTTMVPRELASALIAFSDYSAARPSIIVGRVPAANVSSLVPRGATVLGGMTSPDRRGDAGRTTTILTMPETPDSALVLLLAHFERSGWRPAPLPDFGGQGGFVAIGPVMEGRHFNYCSDSSSVYGSAVEGVNRSAVIRLMTTRSLRNSPCDPDRRAFMRDRMELIALPTLRPPPGATSGGSMGSGGGSDSRESHARLQSGLSAADMIAHFAPQLQQQGWTLGNRASDGDVTVLTARKTDEKGEPMFLTLTDNRFTAREHEVVVRVSIPSRQ